MSKARGQGTQRETTGLGQARSGLLGHSWVRSKGRSRDRTGHAGRGAQGSLQGHEAGPGRTVQKTNFAKPDN